LAKWVSRAKAATLARVGDGNLALETGRVSRETGRRPLFAAMELGNMKADRRLQKFTIMVRE
jgi:hypothetical protein